MTNIQKTAKELRKASIELRNAEMEKYPNRCRIVRLSDKVHDLKARYNMFLRINGHEEVNFAL